MNQTTNGINKLTDDGKVRLFREYSADGITYPATEAETEGNASRRHISRGLIVTEAELTQGDIRNTAMRIIMKFRQTVSFALLTTAAYHWRFAAAVFSIDDVLNLGSNCDTYHDELDTMYSEALDLLTSAIQAVDDARNPLSTNYEVEWYSDVEAFLQDGVTSGDKPWLFCGDDWALRQNMNDQMRDSTGALTTNADGSIYRISDNPDFVEYQQKSTKSYWCDECGGYVFMENFDQTDPTKGGCSQVLIRGGVEYDRRGFTLSENRLMVLCPSSFSGTRLREETPSCIAASLYGTSPRPKAAQRLMDIVPEVYTFFHELFHLVKGNALTIPAGGEQYNVKTMLGNTFNNSQALANPETYTMVA
ncbi:hypothetical protein VMCG_02018 [Cytospora schulzeri]|uniref:Uncharacterized protein n=1 Tax=Cytospora schulzeri TaxID=448051 RepID=A0A423X2K9_9PEZI|nr:hypothetical protein VMCG_02018 [Valsa malicola]